MKKALAGADMVFLTAGLGAGTGSGALPIIAKIAHDLGILSVGVVTVPFKFEGSRKQKAAEAAIAEIAPYLDALIAVHNDNLLKLKSNSKLTLINAFRMADNVLLQGIRCVSELILTVGIINVDLPTSNPYSSKATIRTPSWVSAKAAKTQSKRTAGCQQSAHRKRFGRCARHHHQSQRQQRFAPLRRK